MDERDLATYWNLVEGSILMQATICNLLIDAGILDQAKGSSGNERFARLV
jgi:hypothetical protein